MHRANRSSTQQRSDVSRLLGRALCCALLVLGPLHPARADTGAPYGERIVRAGQSWPEGEPAVVAVPGQHSDGDREAYQAAIEEALKNGGPYQPGLAEPLEGLALWQWAQGDLVTARKLMGRALHAVRVTEGLRSEGQLPLLRYQMALSRRLGDLEDLDKRYGYYFLLRGSGQPPHTGPRLQATLDYLRWQREALRQKLDSETAGDRRLLHLLRLNEDLLEQGEPGSRPLTPNQRWALVQSQLSNFYLLQARLPPPQEDTFELHRETRYPPVETDPLGPRKQLETFRQSTLGRGRRLLEDFRETLPADGPLWSEVGLALADWYQWHGRTSRAAGLYRELAVSLAAGGEQDTLADWFGEPVELPANGAFWQLPEQGDTTPLPVRAQFEVTGTGRARGIETLDVPEDRAPEAMRLRRELYDVRFRPRLAGGEPVATAALEREYLWLPLRRSQ